MKKIDRQIKALMESIYHWYDIACQTFFYDEYFGNFQPDVSADDCACCVLCDQWCAGCAITIHHPMGMDACCLLPKGPYDKYTDYESKEKSFNQAIKMIKLLQTAHDHAILNRALEERLSNTTKRDGAKWQR